ncbi:YecR family lipoprotein [Citrobacter arsenatis]|uniref:YecR family lipoprotein n=1 Tax=Citrobacter arsenatis TaxID=2546350 RepID=UPI00300E22D2
MKNVLVMCIGLVLLSGCAVRKEMTAIGGSKADGTVKLGYSFSEFEKPVVDVQQGINLAAKKCQAWGYSNAEPFGGQQSQCTNFDASGCTAYNVTIEYQCTGNETSGH